MDISKARARAAAQIREGIKTSQGFTPVIVDADTQELPWGWVFFYNSKEYLETSDSIYALAGNAPIVVTRHGEVLETGTARPLDEYLKDLREGVKV